MKRPTIGGSEWKKWCAKDDLSTSRFVRWQRRLRRDRDAEIRGAEGESFEPQANGIWG